MSDLILYTTEDGSTRLDLRIEGETVWLSQSQMADLFQRSKKTISEHLGNIFFEGELQESSVVRNFRTTAIDGKSYEEMKSITEERFGIFETNRRLDEALKADADDLREIENLEKALKKKPTDSTPCANKDKTYPQSNKQPAVGLNTFARSPALTSCVIPHRGSD